MSDCEPMLSLRNMTPAGSDRILYRAFRLAQDMSVEGVQALHDVPNEEIRVGNLGIEDHQRFVSERLAFFPAGTLLLWAFDKVAGHQQPHYPSPDMPEKRWFALRLKEQRKQSLMRVGGGVCNINRLDIFAKAFSEQEEGPALQAHIKDVNLLVRLNPSIWPETEDDKFHCPDFDDIAELLGLEKPEPAVG